MSRAFIVGVHSTPFRKWPEQTFRELAETALSGVLEDAGLESGSGIEHITFANCAMGTWGQSNVRGQSCLSAAAREGRINERAPIVNVEAGCATGSVAFHQIVTAIEAGQIAQGLALGVEKVWVPDDLAKTFGVFSGGIDQLHPSEWRTFFAEEGERTGVGFDPHPHRVLFLDVHAMQARDHMARHGTTPEHLATIAAKNHQNGRDNENAQFRFGMTAEKVLADKAVLAPFTRSMCAPISDGAAALLLVSEQALATFPAAVRDRAICVRSSTLTGGAFRRLGDDTVLDHAARAAYQRAGLSPQDVDMAEVHDATAYCELHAYEALGFCDRGQGGAYALSGATQKSGERPVNASGGLIAKGHPLAATGLGMLEELVVQLRGEAGAKQVKGDPVIALQQNAGGLVGLDEAVCAIHLLERVQ